MLLPLLLLACTTTPADTSDPSDTGDTDLGTGGDMPAYCTEDSRIAITDLTVPAEGFTFAPEVGMARESGLFDGDLTPWAGGPHVALSLAVVYQDTGVDAVYRVLVDPNAGDTGTSMGAPSVSDCPPVYAYALDATLSAPGGEYGASYTAAIEVSDPETATMTGSVPLADVTGTARPTFDVDRWASVTLQVATTQSPTGWTGTLMWFGSSEPAGPTAGQPAAPPADSGSGGSDTGTVAVSGETEGVGDFDLAQRATE